MTSHIGRSLYDIYDALEKDFPEVTLTPLSDKTNKLVIRLVLFPDYPPIDLKNAIDLGSLKQALEDFHKAVRLSRLLKTSKLPTINPHRFSLNLPLIDDQGYQKSQRLLYEKQGLFCQDVITNYLKNNTKSQTLYRLGLAPEQVEANDNIEDLQYFEHISRSLFPSFLKKYPLTAKKALFIHIVAANELVIRLFFPTLTHSTAIPAEHFLRVK